MLACIYLTLTPMNSFFAHSYKPLLLCAVLATASGGLTGCGKLKKMAEARRSQAGDSFTSTGSSKSNTNGNNSAQSAATPLAVVTPTSVPKPKINTSNEVAVLCYHRFENGKGALMITPQEFEAQMKRLKDNNLPVIPMSDLLDWRKGLKDIPPRAVVITLDDGWISDYTEAWPILKKYNYPFTMFIYTDYVRGGKKSGGKSMSWEQLAEMRDAGVDIEDHTTSHSDLRAAKRKMPLDQYMNFLKGELIDSKDLLESKLAIKVRATAFPYGNYTDQVIDVIKKGGYEAGFTVNPQKVLYTSAEMKLGRYAIDGLTPKVFDMAINFGDGSVTESSGSQISSMDVSSMTVKPSNGEVVRTAKPTIEINLEPFGKVDPKSPVLRLSGFGPLPAKYDAETHILKAQVPTNLTNKSYTVIAEAVVDGKKVNTQWNFTVELPQAPGAPNTTSVNPSPTVPNPTLSPVPTQP